MDVKEIFGLCDWLLGNAKPVVTKYNTLQQTLQHNATQQQKQPVKEQLNDLLSSLRAMPMHELTSEQISMLEGQNVIHLLGNVGATNVERIVKSARFDPASAQTDIQEMHQAVNQTVSRFNTLKDSLSAIEDFSEERSNFEQISIRIHFKETAAISDVAAWKEWSNEWFDIVRGIALCVDESPENVKVLGAHQGSVIMVLGATAAVTSVLLLISNHLTKIALNSLQVASSLEDFKHKVKLNKATIDGLEKSIATSEKDALKTLLKEATESLPTKINGEQANALEKSISKYQKFTQKGGEVDFLAPPDPDDAPNEELDEDEIQQIMQVRENVDELRDLREETRLLTSQTHDDEEFEDEDLDEEDEA